VSPVYILLAVAYLNGDPIASQAGKLYTDRAECVRDAKESAENAQARAPHDVQMVYKCPDISQVPIAVSVFGQQ
jgi:hypothetical protein